MAVSRDESTKGMWRFWSALSLYRICCIVALLYGLRMLPHVNGLLFCLAMPSWFLGQGIETWMLNWSQPDTETEYLLTRSLSLGSMYIVPIVLAVTASALGWTLWLSILALAGLMVRVRNKYAARRAG